MRKEREDLCVTELYDSDVEEVVELSEEYFRYKLEEYWNYHDERSGKLINKVKAECSELRTYTGEDGFHDLHVQLDVGDKMDAESEPDARAKVDVSPTADDVDYGNFSNMPMEDLVLSADHKGMDVNEWNHTETAVPDCVTGSILFTSWEMK